jgi:hypothetical protein
MGKNANAKAKAAGLKHCSQCKTYKPLSEFLVPRKKGHDVVFCNDCAGANMGRWARTRNVGLMPEDITSIED